MVRIKTWREHCAPLIQQVLKENEGQPLKEIKAALREAYPWGERSRHPYKIWCSEIYNQLNGKKSKQKHINPNQLKLL